jgi:dTDP-4-amino-4,6-dideoxygalactose transaminase
VRVPLFDPTPRLHRQRSALGDAFARLLDRGTFVLGPAVAAFEGELAAFLGGGEVVGVASGSDALELSLRALDVGPGQAVLTTPFTFVATAEAIHHAGATPVFVDVRDDDLLLDLDAVEERLGALPCSSRGRPLLPSGQEVTALLPVHLFGAVLPPGRLARLCERFRLHLVEDAAQALGGHHGARRAGTFGQAGCFSFFPSKTLGALGDGGAVWTDDPVLAGRIRGLRQHGQPSKQHPSAEPGRNSRLDALQAAMLSVLLPHLDGEIEERRALLRRYRERLSGCPGLSLLGPDPLDGHAAQQVVVRCADRDGLAAHLQACGVGTAVYYRTPLHHLAPYRGCPALGPLACAERAAREALALPLYPGLPEAAVDEVSDRIMTYHAAQF